MPDENDQLTPDEFEKANTWLNEHITLPCPTCDSKNWTILSHVKRLESKDRSLPVVVVLCDVCAQITLFSTLRMGIGTS